MPDGRLHLELCAPDHDPVELEAAEVIIPGAGGVFTVLPGHTNVLSTLTHGVVIATDEEENRDFYAVHGGFAEVMHDRIVILADRMEHGESIDSARAEASSERARQRIQKPEDDTNIERAEIALARSLVRLQAHGKEEY